MGSTSPSSPEETLSRLSGDWWILQLRRGHRYATDDVVTAWTAVGARPAAATVLDLGAGVGSVGLMVLRLLGAEARLVSVEIQEVSTDLARRSVAHNRVAERVDARLGDLRDPQILGRDEAFDLITANPPFLPRGAGWVSRNPQRSAARFELNGDVFDFCRVAAAHLAPNGRFCLCHSATDPRPEQALDQAGLNIVSRRDVSFSSGRRPHIALWVSGWSGERVDLPELCVRSADGQRTAAFTEVLRAVGIAE